MLEGAIKDRQSATPDGPLASPSIQGVVVKKCINIITGNGVTTELFRPEWELDSHGVEHMVYVQLRGSAISAWHMHEKQIDRIFAIDGSLRLVLFDDRADSPTRGRVDVINLCRLAPKVVSIPSGVWHGVQNLDMTPSGFINYFNRAYVYEDPDEWRLPRDTDQIPYRFQV